MTGTSQHLTYKQRCQISALNKSGCGQRVIANIIGTTQSTVSRELARNTGVRGYRHKQAQTMSEKRREEAVKPSKMTPELIAAIESKLRVEWSPEQISGWLLTDQEQLISHESIYLYIWANSVPAVTFTRIFEARVMKYDKRRNGKSTRGQIMNRVSIDDRPGVVDDKSHIGYWGIDTVIGNGRSGALVTIVERVTKFASRLRLIAKAQQMKPEPR